MTLAADTEITVEVLNSMNVEQAPVDNRDHLAALGGIEGLAQKLGVNLETGLSTEQVLAMRKKFGTNEFPASPMKGYFELLFEALNDTTLIILIVAAGVSFVIDSVQHGIAEGWIEGGAIFIAVFLVSNITACNNYVKALQFRAIEQSTDDDERCSVFRESSINRINPRELVVGDIIVLQVCLCFRLSLPIASSSQGYLLTFFWSFDRLVTLSLLIVSYAIIMLCFLMNQISLARPKTVRNQRPKIASCYRLVS